MFAPNSKARGKTSPGIVFAVDGGDGYIYYGQVATDKSIGFINYVSTNVVEDINVNDFSVMTRLLVIYRSIGRALREGYWKVLGNQRIHNDLESPLILVQWPVGSRIVSIWEDGKVIRKTNVEDKTIQNMEIFAAYDAIFHVPKRITYDYNPNGKELVGGPIIRERKLKELYALKFPGPVHNLPSDWVYVDSD